MNKKDFEFLKKFAIASSATVLLTGCIAEDVYGPGPVYQDDVDSTEIQDSSEIDSTETL